MSRFIFYSDIIQLSEYVGIQKADVKGLRCHQEPDSFVIITEDNQIRNIQDKYVEDARQKGVPILESV